MKNLTKILLFVIVCFEAKAQDPTFTQFYSNPVYLNPALAGSS
ncbi:MAG: type IX secretion system membrane protein PorP/SprF, partial [Crocinitomicaceae bacterium]